MAGQGPVLSSSGASAYDPGQGGQSQQRSRCPGHTLGPVEGHGHDMPAALAQHFVPSGEQSLQPPCHALVSQRGLPGLVRVWSASC